MPFLYALLFVLGPMAGLGLILWLADRIEERFHISALWVALALAGGVFVAGLTVAVRSTCRSGDPKHELPAWVCR